MVVPDFTAHLERVAKIVGVSDDHAAMVRCEADVRRQAKHVTTSNEEEGFANAMDAFVLGDREFIGKAS
jgi:hypothetical protein